MNTTRPGRVASWLTRLATKSMPLGKFHIPPRTLGNASHSILDAPAKPVAPDALKGAAMVTGPNSDSFRAVLKPGIHIETANLAALLLQTEETRARLVGDEPNYNLKAARADAQWLASLLANKATAGGWMVTGPNTDMARSGSNSTYGGGLGILTEDAATGVTAQPKRGVLTLARYTLTALLCLPTTIKTAWWNVCTAAAKQAPSTKLGYVRLAGRALRDAVLMAGEMAAWNKSTVSMFGPQFKITPSRTEPVASQTLVRPTISDKPDQKLS